MNFFKARRLELGLTQSEIATVVGTTTSAVSDWERGISLPGPKRIPRLARAYEMEPAELVRHIRREINFRQNSRHL